MHTQANRLVKQLLMKQSDTLPTQYRHIEHLHEEVWCQKIIIEKNDSFVNLVIFPCLLFNRGYACAYIVHTRAKQLVPQLILKQSDTLPTQYRHIEHLHEEAWCQKINYIACIEAF